MLVHDAVRCCYLSPPPWGAIVMVSDWESR